VSLAEEVERVYLTIRAGGLALVKADIGYGLIGHSEESIRRMFRLKRRPLSNPCIVVGSPEVLDRLGRVEDRRVRRWVAEQMRWTTLAVAVPVAGHEPLWTSLPPWVREHASRDGTAAVYLNTGELTDRLVERALRDDFLLVGSSANLSLHGNNYRPEEIPPEMAAGVDCMVARGTAKYENPERLATTIVDLPNLAVRRRGVNAALIEARLGELRREVEDLVMSDVFDQFDRYIQDHRYSRHSFVKQVVSGQVEREGVKAWAIQKYHQTFMQNRVFSAIHANAPQEDIRQFMVEQLIDEETSLHSGPDAHYNLMKRLALAMGATEDEVARSQPAPPVQRFVDYLLTVCRTEPPPYAMLAIYVNESQTPESVKLLADALRRQFGLSDDDLAWFTVHSEDDVGHAEAARDLIGRYGAELPDFERHGRLVIERGCREWTALQDFYYSLVS